MLDDSRLNGELSRCASPFFFHIIRECQRGVGSEPVTHEFPFLGKKRNESKSCPFREFLRRKGFRVEQVQFHQIDAIRRFVQDRIKIGNGNFPFVI